MRLDRILNAKKNIVFGFIGKLVYLLMPFCVQTAIIRTLGIRYIGLNGVFSSVLSVLSLAELGIGSAIVYSMYEPIAQNDEQTICEYLNYYRSAYRKIGLVIFGLGLLVLPFLPSLFKTGYPDEVNIYLLYILFLIKTVMSYFLYAYKSCILLAFQRVDVVSIINTICIFAMGIIQILVMVLYENFYFYLIIGIIFAVLQNLLVSISVDRLYPNYRCSGYPDGDKLLAIRRRVSGLVIGKVCGVSRNASDSIFVSAFIGLTAAGMYSNYYYVMNAVIGILAVIPPAMEAGVGNSIQLEAVEKNLEDMKRINYIYMLLAGWCSICLLCLYQPFMEIWMGKDNLFPNGVVFLFVLYFYVKQMGNIRAMYSDAAGLFWENRYRNLAEAICNPVLNLLFVIKWGIYGIIGATIITLFIMGFVMSAEVLFRCYFHGGLIEYLVDNLKYFLITGVAAVLTYLACSSIELDAGWKLFVCCIICCTVAPALLLALSFRTKRFKEATKWMSTVIFKK